MTHKEEDEPFPEREPELAELRVREVFVVFYVSCHSSHPCVLVYLSPYETLIEPPELSEIYPPAEPVRAHSVWGAVCVEGYSAVDQGSTTTVLRDMPPPILRGRASITRAYTTTKRAVKAPRFASMSCVLAKCEITFT